MQENRYIYLPGFRLFLQAIYGSLSSSESLPLPLDVRRPELVVSGSLGPAARS